MDGFDYQFEWDDAKAANNLRKHGVSFELATTIFNDPRILTVADLEHGDEERWFSVGTATNGMVVSAAYTWSEIDAEGARIRIISARKATRSKSVHT